MRSGRCGRTGSSDVALVRVERIDQVALLTFDRPDKLNALSTPMLRELEAALASARDDPQVRVVVLTGAGDRAFVAGADIEEYAGQSHEDFVAYQRFSRELFSSIDAFAKPVVAAVHGYALGGGFEIVLCCDVVVASTAARFGLPEGRIGLSPGGGGTQRLTRAAGPFVAADVLLAGRRLTAEDALGLGLVSQVVEPEVLSDAALAKAREMSAMAPLSSGAMLELIRTAMDRPLEEGLTEEHEALARLHGTADAAEGVRAFVEKREPRFRGV
jgi:enoyl-CoA hydratase